MLFDTHAHLLDEQFDSDRHALIEEMKPRGLFGYVECATDLQTSLAAAALAKEYAAAYAAIGVHPHSASEWDEHAASVLETLYAERHVVAIGEIGLDYHYDFSPRDAQKKAFREQMALADSLGAPVVIHMREATEDTMGILSEFPGVRGVLHCFTGSVDTMRLGLDMGYWIAFGGAVTFKNAKKPVQAARECPLERMVLETDSPYMTPVPYRGKRNTPFNVRLVCDFISELRGLDAEELAEATTRNAKELFEIS